MRTDEGGVTNETIFLSSYRLSSERVSHHLKDKPEGGVVTMYTKSNNADTVLPPYNEFDPINL